MIDKNEVLLFFQHRARKDNMFKSKRRNVKKWTFVLFLILGVQFLMGQRVKTVFIPDDIKVEENTARETIITNLSDEEVYRCGWMNFIDGFLYVLSFKPVAILKVSPGGSVVKRVGELGTGPGEYKSMYSIHAFKGTIHVLDHRLLKVVIYDNALNFIREVKLTKQYMFFFINKKGEYVFFDGSSKDHYFYVHDESGEFLRKYGRILTPAVNNKKVFNFEAVRCALYIPEEDGVWAAFKNRYDLKYYEKEKWVGEIKAKEGYFKGEKQEGMGRTWIFYHDRGYHLARVADRLYYFYIKDKKVFCDIFDRGSFQLRRRIKFKSNIKTITHYKENIFFAAAYADNEDRDVLLLKLET